MGFVQSFFFTWTNICSGLSSRQELQKKVSGSLNRFVQGVWHRVSGPTTGDISSALAWGVLPVHHHLRLACLSSYLPTLLLTWFLISSSPPWILMPIPDLDLWARRWIWNAKKHTEWLTSPYRNVDGVPTKQAHGSGGRWCSLKARRLLNYLMDIERESGE